MPDIYVSRVSNTSLRDFALELRVFQNLLVAHTKAWTTMVAELLET